MYWLSLCPPEDPIPGVILFRTLHPFILVTANDRLEEPLSRVQLLDNHNDQHVGRKKTHILRISITAPEPAKFLGKTDSDHHITVSLTSAS